MRLGTLLVLLAVASVDAQLALYLLPTIVVWKAVVVAARGFSRRREPDPPSTRCASVLPMDEVPGHGRPTANRTATGTNGSAVRAYYDWVDSLPEVRP